MPPTFSVFIPVHNDARLLPAAIDSVRSQTLDDWELVIGDNASTDETARVAATEDPRIRYHRFEDFVDVTDNFNRTAEICAGEWLVPIGADDALLPHALETFVTAIRERPDLVMVVAACARLDQQGNPAAATWRFYQGLAPLEPGDYDAGAWLRALSADGQPPWNLGSIAFRRAAVEQLGGLLKADAGPASDVELVMRMPIAGPVRYTDERVFIYTQRMESEHRQQQRSDRVDDSDATILGRGLRVALAEHERARGPIPPEERQGVKAMIARSFIQRAAQHRLLAGGRGRRAAWRDVRRAWRASPSTLFSPRQLLFAAGAVITPGWILHLADRALRVRSS
jgi:glycosyltransferase involved in cell wall biosynthesis